MEFTSSGLVREIAEFLSNHGKVPTHPDWIETLACVPISMLGGLERHMDNILGPLPTNIFGIVVGSSGLSFKTVPLQSLRTIIKELTNRYNEDICQKHDMSLNDYLDLRKSFFRSVKTRQGTPGALPKEMQETKSKIADIELDLVDFETVSRFTSEALAGYLITHPVGAILGDEYTKMFKGVNKKSFLTDNMEDLSRLYDCSPDKAVTVSRGVEYPENAFISFVSATTYYLLTMMDDDFFIQGTGNRILWTLDDLDDREEFKEDDTDLSFFYNFNNPSVREQELKVLTNKILFVNKLPKGIIYPDFNAQAILEKHRKSWYNQALRKARIDLLNKDSNYLARCAQNAMKLAMIHCMGRYANKLYEEQDQQIESDEHLFINQEDAVWAVSKIGRHIDHYLKMMELAPNVRKGAYKDPSNDFERVMIKIRLLMNSNTKPTVPMLFNRLNKKYTMYDLQKILGDLMSAGKLEIKQELVEKGANAGKLVVYYVPTEAS